MTERGERNLWKLSRKIRIVPGEKWEPHTGGRVPGRKKQPDIVLYVCFFKMPDNLGDFTSAFRLQY